MHDFNMKTYLQNIDPNFPFAGILTYAEARFYIQPVYKNSQSLNVKQLSSILMHHHCPSIRLSVVMSQKLNQLDDCTATM